MNVLRAWFFSVAIALSLVGCGEPEQPRRAAIRPQPFHGAGEFDQFPAEIQRDAGHYPPAVLTVVDGEPGFRLVQQLAQEQQKNPVIPLRRLPERLAPPPWKSRESQTRTEPAAPVACNGRFVTAHIYRLRSMLALPFFSRPRAG